MLKGVTSPFILSAAGAVVVLLLPASYIFNKEFGERFNGDGEQLAQIGAWSRMSYLIGKLIGAVLITPVANNIGRKAGILCSNCCLQLGLILVVTSVHVDSSAAFIGGKLLLGLCFGLNLGLIPMYLLEVSPFQIRGAAGTSFFLSLTLSTVIVQISDFVSVWPMNYICPFVPGVLQIAILLMCPESPKFNVVLRGNDILGERALVSLRGTTNIHHELDQMKLEEPSRPNLANILTNASLRTPLLLASMTMLAQVICGINAVGFFSTKIFLSAGLSTSEAAALLLGVHFLRFAVVLISLLIVDKVGRRPLLITGFMGMFLTIIFIFLCILFKESAHWISLSVVLIILFEVMFSLGPGPIPWFLASELFPTGSRALATSLVVLAHLVATFVVDLSFLPAQVIMGPYVFIVFASFIGPCCLYLWCSLPETKRKSLGEIVASWN